MPDDKCRVTSFLTQQRCLLGKYTFGDKNIVMLYIMKPT